MIKKILLTILAATLFWMFVQSAFAAIQLDDVLRPDNLPDLSVSEGEIDEEASAEITVTQTIILFVGNLVSQVLLFAGAVSIIFLMVSGGNYIFAFGKDERIEKGKRGIFWSIMGLLTIILSYAIVRGVINLILQLDVQAT